MRGLRPAARAVATIAGTEVRRTLRNRVALFFVVALPVVIIVVIGTTFGAAAEGLEVGVLDRDATGASAALVEGLGRGEGIDVRAYDSVDVLRRDIRTGTVAAGVVVPAGYGEALARGDDVTVDMVADPTSAAAAVVQAGVRAAVGDAAVEIAAGRVAAGAAGVDPGTAQETAVGLAGQVPEAGVRSRTAAGEEAVDLGSFDYTAPSNLVLFTFVNTIVAGSAIALERRQGITGRMLASPHGTGTILTGIGVAKLAFALVQSTLIVLVGWGLFGVDWGDPRGVVLVVVLFAVVATAVGLLVGATVSDPDQAQAVGIPVAIGLGMLGGCMWPLDIVPPLMRTLGHVAPHAWAMDAWVALVLDGEAVSAIGVELAVLAAYALVLGLLASRRLRRSLTG